MLKIVNGVAVEMTAEEIEQHNRMTEKDSVRAELMERSRPLSEAEVSRMLITAQINTLTVDDNTALRMLEFYPEWAPGSTYTAGYKVRHGGALWRVRQSHTSQAGWEPGGTGTESLWEQINETHEGTLDDPVPYNGNMALVAGLYYHQNYEIYRCIRDTGNPVYHNLTELVGLYVETV